MLIEHLLTRGGVACATGLYSHPLVEAVLGGSLHPGGEKLTKELASRAGLKPGSRVLDVGCGKGATSALLAETFGCHVTGVDADPANVAAAQQRANAAGLTEALRFMALPGGRLGELDGTYDAVVSECTLCLMGDREIMLELLRQRLRPGGHLLLSDVTVEAPAESFRQAAGFAACLGGASPDAELRRSLLRGFQIDYADNRPALLAAVRDRIRSRVDVDAILGALGDRTDLRLLVQEAEAALEAGNLGYAVVVARRTG